MPLLDGLRGLAILLVLPHNLSMLPGAEALPHAVGSLLDRGWIGVQLFFALSGFLITGILMDSAGQSGYLKHFFMRRVLRIFPLYYATLALFIALPVAWHGISLQLHPYQWSYFAFLSNWFSPFHQGEGRLPHFWSLAVEEQFYLLWPFLLYRRSAEQVFRLCIGVATISLAVRGLILTATHWPEVAVYQFTICRADALALGAAAAAWLRMPARSARPSSPMRWPPAKVALAILAAGAVATKAYQIYGLLPQTIGYTALSAACALLVLACAGHGASAAWQRPLQWRWLQLCGRYSYGMYVIHVPLHTLVMMPLLQHMGWIRPGNAGIVLPYIAVGSMATMALAALSYRYLESPFLALKRRFEPGLPHMDRLRQAS
jgi:peptidoglycan/LPS O-acetylase OafA/YrhL